MDWLEEILDPLWHDFVMAHATFFAGVGLIVAAGVLCWWGNHIGPPWAIRCYCIAGVAALGGIALIWRWASED